MKANKWIKIYRVTALLLLGIGFGGTAFAQTTGTNYVRTRSPRIPVTDTSKLDTIPVQRQAVSMQYSDALGRTMQSILLQGSPKLNDIIMPYAYDYMGRTAKAYLPYVDTSTTTITKGTFRSSALTSAVSFYNPSSPGAPKIPTDTCPFARTIYETSPLGRVNEQGEVGAVSQPGAGHSVKASYQVNSLADSIRYYYNILDGTSVTRAAFNAGTLTKTILTDENGHRIALWKDLQGRTVTRTQLDAPTPYYSTDYVYNDLGQLSDIITPNGKKRLVTPGGVFPQAYIFHYDSVGRIVEKKVPGKGWVFTVYNRGDQPVLSQDSNMRGKHQWMYIKYDAEGRVVQTGIYTNTVITTRKAMQYFCDNSFSILWETWQPGTGYTNNAFPQQSATPGSALLALYSTFYYDDYSFTEASSKPFQTNTYGTTPSFRTMGMLTGVSIYVLGTSSQRLVTVNYYDNQDRLIQQISDNHLGYVDVVNNQYNFIGEVTGSQRTIVPFASTSYVVQDKYVYDQSDRLLDTWESFQGAAQIDISHNVYNEVGQKVSEGLNSVGSGSLPATAANITENTTLSASKTDIASNSVVLSSGFTFAAASGKSYKAAIGYGYAQTQEFRYNIKGLLTNINNGTLTYDSGVTQSDSTALFGESITYWDSSPLSGTAPQYNGNISGMTWRNKIEKTGKPGVLTGGQGYSFGYDNVNRLTQTGYYTQTGGTFTKNTANALTEMIKGYDEMGNIDTLQRKDITGSNQNNLTYTYQTGGNQLVSVSDAGSQSITGTFTYDGNGNMVTDSKKGITVTYNYLDLPDTVKQGSSKLVFTYDAAGNKLYKQLITSGTVVSQRHYVEEAEIVATSSLSLDGHVESIAMDEGRIVNTGTAFQYEYFLQDHLYNNRVAFRVNSDGTLKVTQVQNYYPFGGDMGDTTMNYTALPVNLHKYNGNEWQQELNLNDYDFGARHYNPQLGRWMVIDPLGEASEELSPYNFTENNPINLIDPDGMQSNPGSTYHVGFPIGGGSSGGTIGWGLALGAVSAVQQTWSAMGAFNINRPVVKQDWTGLNKVQGNSGPHYNPPLPQATVSQWEPNLAERFKNSNPVNGLLYGVVDDATITVGSLLGSGDSHLCVVLKKVYRF